LGQGLKEAAVNTAGLVREHVRRSHLYNLGGMKKG
jgi:hypothetical protein